MRIGILTLPLGDNFGGVLQNYALQETLRMENHQPITITHEYFYPWYINVYKKIRNFVVNNRKTKLVDGSISECVNTGFIDKHITTTQPCSRLSNKLINKYKLDAVIVGSDQVWRPRYNPNNLPDFYLRFVKTKACLKFAYAASFGVDNCEYSPQQIKACNTYAHKLKGISVREESGVALCENYYNIKPAFVLDPTLLLDKEKYVVLCKSTKYENNSYVLAYVLDENDNFQTIIKSVSASMKLPIRMVKADGTECIEDWLSLFKNAAFVVTDSFHGTVFSIIFEKNFFSIPNLKRGASRFESLMSNLGLMDRLVREEYNLSLVSQSVNWIEVNKKLKLLKDASYSFIREMLS